MTDKLFDEITSDGRGHFMPIVADFCRVRFQQWIKVIIVMMVIFLCNCFDRGSILSLTKCQWWCVILLGLQWLYFSRYVFRTSCYRLKAATDYQFLLSISFLLTIKLVAATHFQTSLVNWPQRCCLQPLWRQLVTETDDRYTRVLRLASKPVSFAKSL